MNKRTVSLLALAAVAVTGLTTTFALARRMGGFSIAPTKTMALSYNDKNIDTIRNEGDKYDYSTRYTAGGLEIDLQGGDYTGWEFGLTAWEFPAPKHVEYLVEFTVVINVNGSEAGGKEYCEVGLEAKCKGEEADGSSGETVKKNFVAGEEFTIKTTFLQKTGGEFCELHLKLGALRNAAGENKAITTVKRFRMCEIDSGTDKQTEIERINFQTASGFAADWKANHVGKAYCEDTDGIGTEMLRDFCALRETERNVVAGEKLPVKGKVITRFDDEGGTIELAANSWVPEGKEYEAHGEVTKACSDVWRAGMFINTGIAFETGKSYAVSLEIGKKNDLAFEFILQNDQWSDVDHRYDFHTEAGHYEKTVTVADGMSGSLWILVQFGNTVNEITVSDITVAITETDTDGTSSIIESVRYIAERLGVSLGK